MMILTMKMYGSFGYQFPNIANHHQKRFAAPAGLPETAETGRSGAAIPGRRRRRVGANVTDHVERALARRRKIAGRRDVMVKGEPRFPRAARRIPGGVGPAQTKDQAGSRRSDWHMQ